MTFDLNLVFSKDIKDHDKTIVQLNDRKCIKKYFAVAFKGTKNELEIYPTLQFLQKAFSTSDLRIIGLFKDEDEALEFVRRLAEISVREKGTIDFVYAFNNYREEEE